MLPLFLILTFNCKMKITNKERNLI